MSDYKDNLKCNKIIDDEKGNSIECGKSPARLVPIFNINLCEEHQKELSHFINVLLGEDDYDDFMEGF